METHLVLFLPFLFNAQGAKLNLPYMNFPPPVRKEVLQWEMMPLLQQMVPLSQSASVNVVACYIWK